MSDNNRNIGVHQSHCCSMHGCKYGESETCPVVVGEVVQDYLCECCSMDGIESIEDLTRRSKLETNQSIKIEIGIEPDAEMSKQGTPYSWGVLRYDKFEGWKAIQMSWSITTDQAYQDACSAIQTYKKNK